MNTLKMIIMGGLLVSMTACGVDMFGDVMTKNDKTALISMEIAYANAAGYNSSLAAYIESTGVNNDSTCYYYDAMFHQNDSTFEANHMMYSHNNDGDDHSADSWTMGMGIMNGSNSTNNSGMMGANGANNGGMMGSGFNSANCTQGNVDLMDSLMLSHEEYHPDN